MRRGTYTELIGPPDWRRGSLREITATRIRRKIAERKKLDRERKLLPGKKEDQYERMKRSKFVITWVNKQDKIS